MILDIHVDNKNDNIKENLYQCKEVAINITHMATENQEIMHNLLQTDQISLDIDTNNTKNHIPVTKKKLTTYTLWNLPRLFNNGQVKRLMGRYAKVQEICWTCEKFSKQAHIILSKKNEKSKKMLEDSWVLPIEKRLTRITVGDNQEEDLEIRKQHRLTLHGLPGNTAEVLLLYQVRHLKAKAVYIPVNANFNPRRSAFVYFSSNEDLLRAYKSKFKQSNSNPDTRRVHEKTQGTHSWSANLKGKEKEHLKDDVGYMMKDRFMRINKAEGSRKMKTSEDYQVLKLASTKDMDLVTNSDHKLLITALDTGINTRFRSHAEMRKKDKRRLVFELEKATEDDWVHYKGKLERLLLFKIHINKEISMDKEWDIIQSSIIKAAQTSLPMKKKLAEILKTENTEKTDVLQLLRKRIRKLGTFCHRIKKRVLMLQEEKELHELCKDIEKNYEIDTSCEQTQDTEEKRRDLENI
ncbi:31833_t:CDS:2 [Gigaspora margarita]|uniref:31833_t:CDS:1 n=1 Tax=Gigaspora margarita TaxID=4874 RepID=A0ABN7V6M3_GIGMA|nr:31833_t:CDS:2 [Gigaspora margarita]